MNENYSLGIGIRCHRGSPATTVILREPCDNCHSEGALRPKNLALQRSFAAEPALSGCFSLDAMLLAHAKGGSG